MPSVSLIIFYLHGISILLYEQILFGVKFDIKYIHIHMNSYAINLELHSDTFLNITTDEIELA